MLRPGGRLLLLTPDVGSADGAARRPALVGAARRPLLLLLAPDPARACWRARASPSSASRALGRVFPLAHWVFKLAPYSRALQRAAARAVARRSASSSVQISINLGDQMACVAQKK